MGIAEDQMFEKRGNKRERAKAARGRRQAAAGTFSWDIFDWFAVIALTEIVCAASGAVRVGFTRDGGAVALGIYVGDDYATEYIRPNEDFPGACHEIAAAWVKGSEEKFRTRYAQLSGR